MRYITLNVAAPSASMMYYQRSATAIIPLVNPQRSPNLQFHFSNWKLLWNFEKETNYSLFLKKHFLPASLSRRMSLTLLQKLTVSLKEGIRIAYQGFLANK